jgi:hypothetical protein
MTREGLMALIVTFDVPELGQKEYDGIIQDLEASGLGNPEGRTYHVAGMSPKGWHVTDVWESEESFGRFGQQLLPIIQKYGVNPQPAVFPAHNIIQP